jgi:outer membrane protein TolC
MRSAKPLLALVLCLTVVSSGFAQTPPTPQITGEREKGIAAWFTNNYKAHPIPVSSFADSPRLEKLMRAGNIYLSLRDAIALALENNLDLESARYNPKLADVNLLRAQAGALLRNVSNSISQGPSSASIGVLASTQLGSGGTASGGGANSGTGGVLSGLNVQLAGSAIPNLDPQFFINAQFVHNTSIQTATNITGTNFLVTEFKSSNAGIQQGFLTGTSLQLGMGNQFGVTQNSPFNMFTPYTQSSLSLSIQQNLLQGFRPSVNNRAIRVAKNQRNISDLTFKNQVMATVSNVATLYWDLVTFNEALKARQQTLELNNKLFADNKRRADLGAIAPIDIVQAEAEVKVAQQEVTNAEMQVLQQETILKTVLTRSGLERQEIANAHIVPTDHFEVPAQEAVQPVQDLIALAMQNRPDVLQSAIGIENARITTLGVKDAMLPQLTAFATTSNSGLAGQVNSLPVPVQIGGQQQLVQRSAADVNGYFLGGYGTVLSQLFGRNFPNYSAGISLSIPIRNRAAQADYVTDQLNFRQQLIQEKQLHNNIRQGVINSQITLANSRAALETSIEARRLQDQTQTGTRRKYELGTATILDVVITQRESTNRQLAEVQARNNYIHSRINMDSVLGRVLEVYGVNIDEAKNGVVARPADIIPPPPAAAAARKQ